MKGRTGTSSVLTEEEPSEPVNKNARCFCYPLEQRTCGFAVNERRSPEFVTHHRAHESIRLVRQHGERDGCMDGPAVGVSGGGRNCSPLGDHRPNLQLQRYVAARYQYNTTIVTFLMVFLIQNSQNRDTLALQVKLAELILAMKEASHPSKMQPTPSCEKSRRTFRNGLNSKAGARASLSDLAPMIRLGFIIQISHARGKRCVTVLIRPFVRIMLGPAANRM